MMLMLQETLRVLKRLEDKMRIVARTYEVDKLKLHIQEIEKIIALIVSLTYRLVPVDTSLANMEWNGVEERWDRKPCECEFYLMKNMSGTILRGGGRSCWSSWRRRGCCGGTSRRGRAWWRATSSRTSPSRCAPLPPVCQTVQCAAWSSDVTLMVAG